MILNILQLVIPVIGRIIGLIDKAVPDKTLREKLKAEMNTLQMTLQNQVQLAQIDVNKEAMKHKSLFVAGARPFILWTCGVAICYHYILYDQIVWAWTSAQAMGYIPTHMEHPPRMDLTQLWPLVFGLLGIGGMRSWEKSKGIEGNKAG